MKTYAEMKASRPTGYDRMGVYWGSLCICDKFFNLICWPIFFQAEHFTEREIASKCGRGPGLVNALPTSVVF